MERFVAVLGLAFFVGISYLFSVNRRAVCWTTVLWGIALQLFLAIIIIRTSLGFEAFQYLGRQMEEFLNLSDAGAKFVFGEQFQDHFFAFKVLPTIIFFCAFVNILYHYGILQKIVHFLAWIMLQTMKTSGAETLSCASNIFLGPTESPLLIKPYIKSLTMSELNSVMTAGFGTIAGSVIVAYLSFDAPPSHLIAATFMSAPASMAIAKLLYPETEIPVTSNQLENISVESHYINPIEAAAEGASEGMKLALNVAAMLIAFLALLGLINGFMAWVGSLINLPQLSLEWLLSWVMSPIAWLMGVPWADCRAVGILLGKKTILNEFIAYLDLQQLIKNNALSERAINITTYALCGFANIGSIGITLGGLGAMVPERQKDLAKLGLRAMMGGALANLMTASIAGMLL